MSIDDRRETNFTLPDTQRPFIGNDWSAMAFIRLLLVFLVLVLFCHHFRSVYIIWLESMVKRNRYDAVRCYFMPKINQKQSDGNKMGAGAISSCTVTFFCFVFVCTMPVLVQKSARKSDTFPLVHQLLKPKMVWCVRVSVCMCLFVDAEVCKLSHF